jgi:hypothetical protein
MRRKSFLVPKIGFAGDKPIAPGVWYRLSNPLSGFHTSDLRPRKILAQQALQGMATNQGFTRTKGAGR